MPSQTPVPPPEGSIDAGVPWHYGEPFAEQRALAAGSALVDLSHRGVIRVTGADRLKWLNDLTTQDLKDLAEGDSALTLVLDPHGRVEYELHVIHEAAQTWLIVEPFETEAVLKYLDSMRFMLDVAVADVTDEFAVIGSGEPAARSSAPTWIIPAEYRGLPVNHVRNAGKYVPQRPAPLNRSEFIVRRAELAATLANAPTLAGTWAWEALRVAAGVPRTGLDTDNRTIPHEVGWIGPAVHLVKGCYRGQETVARVHNLGRPPRRLVLLHFDGSAGRLPSHGDSVTLPGETAGSAADAPAGTASSVGTVGSVGSVGTVAQHHELGPIGLAVIKKSVPTNVDLVVHSAVNGTVVAARQQPIVVA